MLIPLQACKSQVRRSAGFTKNQALLALLVVFPLGIIGVGLILNVVMKTRTAPAPAPEAPVQQQQPEPPAESQPSASSQESRQPAPATTAQKPTPSVVELGQASTEAPIRLLMGSINQRDAQFREFTYQLGNDSVQAMANCTEQSWTSYPERQVNRPQSPATERMVALVCGTAPSVAAPSPTANNIYPGVAIVFDPPSNVRRQPGGNLLCSIDTRQSIRVGQAQGNWYPTPACGTHGFIHKSQVRF